MPLVVVRLFRILVASLLLFLGFAGFALFAGNLL